MVQLCKEPCRWRSGDPTRSDQLFIRNAREEWLLVRHSPSSELGALWLSEVLPAPRWSLVSKGVLATRPGALMKSSF